MENPKIFVTTFGFYYFGNEVETGNNFIACNQGAMFRKFGGGKGLPGVARGDKNATVSLDTFELKEILYFHPSNLIAILPSINLYEFKGATING
jgi:hypothetical protein